MVQAAPLAIEGLRATMRQVYLTCFANIYCKVSHGYRSILYSYIILQNQCDHDNIILWPLANPYINAHLKDIHRLFSQNVNFTLNTLLHGALQLVTSDGSAIWTRT